MYLYDKNGDKIEVYSMEPNTDKIYKFKKEEIKKIPIEKRVLKAVTNNSLVFDNPKKYATYLSKFVYQKPTFLNKTYHNLVSSNSKDFEKIKILLELYCKDEIKYKIPLSIDSNNEYPKYLLFTEFNYLFDSVKSHDRTLDNIICLTKNLYLLEKILDKKVLLLGEENIEEHISLFDISNKPISTIDLEELKKAELFNLIPECEFKTNYKLAESQKILKYIKK